MKLILRSTLGRSLKLAWDLSFPLLPEIFRERPNDSGKNIKRAHVCCMHTKSSRASQSSREPHGAPVGTVHKKAHFGFVLKIQGGFWEVLRDLV